RAPDEQQSLERGLAVLAVPDSTIARVVEQPATFVVAHRLDVHPGTIGELADPHSFHHRIAHSSNSLRVGSPSDSSLASTESRWSAPRVSRCITISTSRTPMS